MVRLSNIFYVPIFLILLSCYEKSEDKAQTIIDQAIEKHGGELYQNFRAEFDFRDKAYVIIRDNGDFEYQRIFEDSIGQIKDVLNNSGFTRYVNNHPKELSDEWERKYTNSVNSVAYFAMLPFGLNDPAVIKEYLGEKELEGKNYHKIKITFRQDGGGEDFNDEFVYWIDQEDYSMDYLAYLYYTDGGGMRFRKAINQRDVNGIIFSDYLNFTHENEIENISKYDSLYENDKLKKVSEIIIEDLEVTIK